MKILEINKPGSSTLPTDNGMLGYSGSNVQLKHQNGVGILVEKNVIKSLTSFIPLSERVVMLQL